MMRGFELDWATFFLYYSTRHIDMMRFSYNFLRLSRHFIRALMRA